MENNSGSAIEDSYTHVKHQIQIAAERAGRDPDSLKLVVVTKGHPIKAIEKVVAAGAQVLGENYVEEAVQKINALGGRSTLEWHMIGHIQSRKARAVCENFTYVHSLDSLKLARRLDRFASEYDKVLPVLLECNVSGESTKYGWPVWDKVEWEKLVEEVGYMIELSNLRLCGLMTMPPFSVDPEYSRPYYILLRELRTYLADRFRKVEWRELSMGMSNDFVTAIQEGATVLRIGTAIMGPRPG